MSRQYWLWSLQHYFSRNNASQKQDVILLFPCISPFSTLIPSHSLFHHVPLWWCLKGRHLVKSLTTGFFSSIHLTPPSYLQWTASPPPPCLPFHWNSLLLYLQSPSLTSSAENWLTVFWIQYVPHLASFQHLEPPYQEVPFKMLLALQI